MASQAPVIDHPTGTPFPFINLPDIKEGTRMRSRRGLKEIVFSAPIPVNGGKGSYFHTIRKKEGRVLVRTMQGRSDSSKGVWIYAGEQEHQWIKGDTNYKKARELLANGDSS